jgi:hypothetical protein
VALITTRWQPVVRRCAIPPPRLRCEPMRASRCWLREAGDGTLELMLVVDDSLTVRRVTPAFARARRLPVAFG